MKVTAEHVSLMRQAIEQLDTAATRQQYRTGNFTRSELTKDVDKRYQWDLFWAANTSYPNTIKQVLNANYKDDHIDTALRSIVAPLNTEV